MMTPRYPSLIAAICSLPLLQGCSSDGDDDLRGTSISCDAIPSCYTDAMAALKACVPQSALELGPVLENSGVVDGLRCSGGDVGVTFSAFTTNPNGTVPIPSGVTITESGAPCAVLGFGTGSFSGESETSTYDLATIEYGTTEVTVRSYDDGALAVECQDQDQELLLSASQAAECPAAILFPSVQREDDITRMSVELIDSSGTSEDLFVCE
jgi:hypothetical protein